MRIDFETIIVGTGFSGLGMAIRLKQEGKDSFVILEKAREVGGTWRENHYPGCACDVPSHLYSFSFEPNPNWSRMFAPQAEILAYLKHCADKYGVRPHIRFNQEIAEARFEEREGIWEVRTTSGDVLRSRFLVLGLGALSRPSVPKIKGLDQFAGTTFHSAEWNHHYDVAGKNVAVIGTGASAIQFVPQIAPKVKKLSLFQRTPPWVLPKPDKAIPALGRWAFNRIPATETAFRYFIYWWMEARGLGFTLNPKVMKFAEVMGRRYIRNQIQDPAKRKMLTPDYTPGCKRILISNDYYPALDRKNVKVVTDDIREISRAGVITRDGVEHKVDAIIFGTGFKVTELLTPLKILGRGGVDINDVWRKGVEAYMGTTVSGFPNAFMLMGPNTGLGHNSMVFMIESQIHLVLNTMRLVEKGDLAFADVKLEAQNEYNARLQPRLQRSVWASGCESWYLDANGKNTTAWPGFTFEFWAKTLTVNRSHFEWMPRVTAKKPVRRRARAGLVAAGRDAS